MSTLQTKRLYVKVLILFGAILIVLTVAFSFHSTSGGATSSEPSNASLKESKAEDSRVQSDSEIDGSVESVTVASSTTTTTTIPRIRDRVESEIAVVTTTTTTLPEIVQPPTNFHVSGYIKKSSYWLVTFEWTLSTTPGVSYCITRDVHNPSDCHFNSLLTFPGDSVELEVGDTDFIAYYLAAVTPAGVKSVPVSASYAMAP